MLPFLRWIVPIVELDPVVASLVIRFHAGPAARTNTKSERFSEKRALTRVRVQGASTGDIAYGSWLLAYSLSAA